MARSDGKEHPGSKRAVSYNVTGGMSAEDEAFYKFGSGFSQRDQ
jgi:hypothetical protein